MIENSRLGKMAMKIPLASNLGLSKRVDSIKNYVSFSNGLNLLDGYQIIVANVYNVLRYSNFHSEIA